MEGIGGAFTSGMKMRRPDNFPVTVCPGPFFIVADVNGSWRRASEQAAAGVSEPWIVPKRAYEVTVSDQFGGVNIRFNRKQFKPQHVPRTLKRL